MVEGSQRPSSQAMWFSENLLLTGEMKQLVTVWDGGRGWRKSLQFSMVGSCNIQTEPPLPLPQSQFQSQQSLKRMFEDVDLMVSVAS